MAHSNQAIDPAPARDPHDIPEDMRWTAPKQRIFLDTLSYYGNVRVAAAQCFMSTRACYGLRTRHDGAAFNLGWNAAILLARGRLMDELMIRALDGQRDTMERDEEGRMAARHRFDNRLALGLLTRLDRMADAPLPGTESADVRIIAQDFTAFLELVESGGTGDEAAAFVAARRPADPAAATVDTAAEKTAEARRNERCEHCFLVHPQSTEECRADPDILAATMLAEFARELSVWREGDEPGVPQALWGDYRTNFPPPDDFAGTEYGVFAVDDDYSRTLTALEQAVEDAKYANDTLDLMTAGEIARLRWFKLPWHRVDADEDEGETEDEGESAGPAKVALAGT